MSTTTLLETRLHNVGSGTMVSFVGTLDESTVTSAREAVHFAKKLGGQVYLDLANVQTVDSTGLEMVDGLTARGVNDGSGLPLAAVVRPSEALTRLRELLFGHLLSA